MLDVPRGSLAMSFDVRVVVGAERGIKRVDTCFLVVGSDSAGEVRP